MLMKHRLSMRARRTDSPACRCRPLPPLLVPPPHPHVATHTTTACKLHQHGAREQRYRRHCTRCRCCCCRRCTRRTSTARRHCRCRCRSVDIAAECGVHRCPGSPHARSIDHRDAQTPVCMRSVDSCRCACSRRQQRHSSRASVLPLRRAMRQRPHTRQVAEDASSPALPDRRSVLGARTYPSRSCHSDSAQAPRAVRSR